MNRDRLTTAIVEAERFLARAKALPKAKPYSHPGDPFVFAGDSYPKEWGSIRRASMDLTRALADLRKPD